MELQKQLQKGWALYVAFLINKRFISYIWITDYGWLMETLKVLEIIRAQVEDMGLYL
jgi:hypothetical protein